MPCKKEEDEVNIFEEQEDYYQFLNTLDVMAQSYESDGTPLEETICLDGIGSVPVTEGQVPRHL